MSRLAVWFHQKDFALFNFINHSCHHKYLDPFFRFFTHLGGATCTISIALLLTMSTPAPYSLWAIDSLIALTISHIIVSIIKKCIKEIGRILPTQRQKRFLNGLQIIRFLLDIQRLFFQSLRPLCFLCHR